MDVGQLHWLGRETKWGGRKRDFLNLVKAGLMVSLKIEMKVSFPACYTPTEPKNIKPI